MHIRSESDMYIHYQWSHLCCRHFDFLSDSDLLLCSMADVSSLVSEGQNSHIVVCTHCESRVLSPQSATLLKKSYPLPMPTQPKNQLSTLTEDLSEWWVVDDMFTFDNIGFSHSVGSTKYLVCADCERGPVGWHDNNTRKSYVALTRVKHA